MKKMDAADTKIQYADPRKLKLAYWNPDSRTKARNIQDLVESIRKNGFYEYEAVLVGYDQNPKWLDTVGDGNRRTSAALALGLEKIPAIFLDMPAKEIWAMRAGLVRPPTLRETGQAIVKGLDVIPARHVRILEDLVRISGGWDAARKVLESGTSPYIVRTAQRIANYCGMKGDDEFAARAIKWLKDNRMQKIATLAIEDRENPVDPDTLLTKILENAPLRSKYQ